MLIDSGASHNFISATLVSQLGLHVEPTPTYNVRLGNGHKKTASGCCPKVEVHLGNYMIKETFFLFELGGGRDTGGGMVGNFGGSESKLEDVNHEFLH